MSEKALKTALGVLAGLVILYGLVLITRPSGVPDSDGGALARALADLDAETIGSVTIAGPTETLSLESEDGVWTVNGYAAEQNSVDRLWSTLAETRVGSVAASNPANHRRLGVAEDSTWSVTFHRTDGEDVRILLGKTGPSYTSAYVRLPDEDQVYLVEGGLRGAASRRLEDWRDRTIAEVDTAAIASVVVGRDGASATVTRGEDGWQVDGAAADTTVVGILLRELGGLEATGFADEDAAFEGPDARSVAALDAQGDTLSKVELRVDDTTVLARAAGNPVVFLLSTFRADRVAPTLESLAQADDPAGS